jgi:hypothetical protein
MAAIDYFSHELLVIGNNQKVEKIHKVVSMCYWSILIFMKQSMRTSIQNRFKKLSCCWNIVYHDMAKIPKSDQSQNTSRKYKSDK